MVNTSKWRKDINELTHVQVLDLRFAKLRTAVCRRLVVGFNDAVMYTKQVYKPISTTGKK